MATNYAKAWVAVGDEANWERGFENGIWGLVPKLENHWKRMQSGDLILFYCKTPIKGFVGAGIIRSRFRQTQPYWKEELEAGSVIWPFRFEFDTTHLIPLDKWCQLAVSNKPFNTAILAGISPVKNLDIADFRYNLLKKLGYIPKEILDFWQKSINVLYF